MPDLNHSKSYSVYFLKEKAPDPKTWRYVKPAATQETKAVTFLITSDTHDFELPAPKVHTDVFLHCGDITNCGDGESIKRAMEWIASIDAELKLVIAGNHDGFLDHRFYKELHKQHGDGGSGVCYQAFCFHQVISSKIRERGVIFLAEGTYEFQLSSGAVFSIYASPYTPEYGLCAFQYPTNEDRYNEVEDLSRPQYAISGAKPGSIIPEGVDIVMTHGPAKYILDDTSDGGNAGCEHLRRAIARVKPKLHCFGHVHRGYGAQLIDWDTSSPDIDDIRLMPKEWVGKNQAKRKGYASIPPARAEEMQTRHCTLAVNAALMDEESEPVNQPWLVELKLPVREPVMKLEEIYE
jgi:hypothetical protein